MVREIQAQGILHRVRGDDTWFGLKYSMNLYRGCQHGCVYCDTRSSCYGIIDISQIAVKSNAIALLRKELAGKRDKGTVGTGSMNDPYMPIEKELGMIRQALQALSEFHFPVHISTKGTLVTRDIDLLQEIAKVYVSVSFSINTVEDELAAKLEPGAPAPSERLKTMAQVAQEGILTGINLMPILPYLTDRPEQLARLVVAAKSHGAQYALIGGLTQRDTQREYFYRALDREFPGIKGKYQQLFGDLYVPPPALTNERIETAREICERQNLPTKMPFYHPSVENEQLQIEW